jgi:hypothetical protein
MTPKTLTSRITKYDISNIFINDDLYFLPQEIRQSTHDKYPVGTIVTATIEKGSVKTIDAAKGAARDKFLKEEEAKRNAQSGSPPPTPLEEKLVKAGFNKAPVKEKAKKEKETRPAIMEIDKSGKETHPDISEVETSQVCESSFGAIDKMDDLLRKAIAMPPRLGHIDYEIPFTNAIDAVIEMKKMSTDTPKTYADLEDEVKRDAVRLFLWCNGFDENQKKEKGAN